MTISAVADPRFLQALDKTATVHARIDEGATDGYKDPVPGEAAGEDYPAYGEQTAGTEVLVGRDTAIADWLWLIGPNDDLELPSLTAKDRIEVDGVSYELVGPPRLAEVPSAGPHHWEARATVTVSG